MLLLSPWAFQEHQRFSLSMPNSVDGGSMYAVRTVVTNTYLHHGVGPSISPQQSNSHSSGLTVTYARLTRAATVYARMVQTLLREGGGRCM